MRASSWTRTLLRAPRPVKGGPHSTFAQPPRHRHRNDQAEQVTHWITAAMPWDGRDERA
jgi:hypothetical protein